MTENGYNYDQSLSGNKVSKSLATTTEWAFDPTTGNVGNNISTNNTSGFSALPCGIVFLTSFGYNAGWWTNDSRFLFVISSASEELYQMVDGSEKNSYTVRCIKD